jgi:hypothetical protein
MESKRPHSRFRPAKPRAGVLGQNRSPPCSGSSSDRQLSDLWSKATTLLEQKNRDALSSSAKLLEIDMRAVCQAAGHLAPKQRQKPDSIVVSLAERFVEVAGSRLLDFDNASKPWLSTTRCLHRLSSVPCNLCT